MTMPILRPTVAEVDLSKFKRNLLDVKKRVEDAKILLVLKANAYGHGGVRLGQYAEQNHLADFFGAASVEEGLALRQAGITSPILVLGSIYPFEAFEYAIENNLALTIASLDAANAVKAIAQKLGKTALCHVKQDTGMGRIGARRAGVIKVIEALANQDHIALEGVFTHLSSADTDPDYTEEQIGYFRDTLTGVKLRNIHVPYYHIANSPGLLRRSDCFYDMVRTGHCAFGLTEGFEPILSLKTRIVYTKEMLPGGSISYSRSFRAPQPMKVATIPVGYGDGYLRSLSNKADVLVKGKRCKILGNITMDMCMIDVTHVPNVHVGEEVALIGTQGEEVIAARELAGLAGTIDYEITTQLMPRVPRVYKE